MKRKFPFRLRSEERPIRSWVIRRSNTKGTGSVSLVRYPSNSTSPQCWPQIRMTCCVLALCVVRKRSVSHVTFWCNSHSGAKAVEKNVCQRLADQASSLRWDLICPSQDSQECVLEVVYYESIKSVFLMWLFIKFIFSFSKKQTAISGSQSDHVRQREKCPPLLLHAYVLLPWWLWK